MPPANIEMLIPPFSQLLIVSVVVYIILAVLFVLKCSRKDMKILFVVMSMVVVSSALAASISVYVQNTRFLSGIVGVTTVFLPAIFMFLILRFLHGKKIGRRLYIVTFMFMFAAGVCAVFAYPGTGITGFVRLPPLFLYVCICFSVSIGELTLEKQPGYELMVIGSATLFFIWLFYLQSLLTYGFGEVSTTIMAAQFTSSFFLIPVVIAILRSNPVIVPTRRKNADTTSSRSYRTRLSCGTLYLLDEKRPRYSYAIFTELVNNGCPGLLVTKGSPGRIRTRYGLKDIPIVKLQPFPGKTSLSPSQLGRIHATVKEFLYGTEHGVVLLDNLEYLFSNDDFFEVAELVKGLVNTVQRSNGILIVPLSLLTSAERRWTKGPGAELLTAPDLETEISNILTETFGDVGPDILERSCKKIGVNRKELIPADLPVLAKEIGSIAADFEGSLGDKTLSSYWQQKSQKATESVLRLGLIEKR